MNFDLLFAQYAQSHQNKWNKRFHRLGIPMIAISVVGLLATGGARWAWELFIVGWILQIVGHAIEGTRPEFLRNPIFVIIGPLYFFKQIFKSVK